MNRIIGESGENPEQVRYCVRSFKLVLKLQSQIP